MNARLISILVSSFIRVLIREWKWTTIKHISDEENVRLNATERQRSMCSALLQNPQKAIFFSARFDQFCFQSVEQLQRSGWSAPYRQQRPKRLWRPRLQDRGGFQKREPSNDPPGCTQHAGKGCLDQRHQPGKAQLALYSGHWPQHGGKPPPRACWYLVNAVCASRGSRVEKYPIHSGYPVNSVSPPKHTCCRKNNLSFWKAGFCAVR